MSRRYLYFAAAVGLSLIWTYWPTLAGLLERWGRDPQYSHGYVVPAFAVFLLWWRRDQFPADAGRPNWWGMAVLGMGLVLHLAGAFLYFDWFSGVSLLFCLAGLAVLMGGWQLLGWSWPAIAFLMFMLPLPHRLEVALAQPLQRIGTLASTYILQTLGFAAFSEGNIICLGQIRIGVVEACSGLSMLMIFFFLAVAVTSLIDRPWLDKVLIVLSAVFIAVFANVMRITGTAILHKTVGSAFANFVHDKAGWLMMLLALGVLWLELRLLAWVLVPAPRREETANAQAGFLAFAQRSPLENRLVPQTVEEK